MLRSRPLVAVLLAFLVLGGAVAAPAEAATAPGRGLQWIRQFGGVGPVVDVARAAAAAADGSIYVVGRADGSFPGETVLGSLDGYLRRYDAGGTELWTRRFETTGWDTGFAVTADAAGGIYVVGTTFSGGGTGEDVILRKYDAMGTELWTRRFGTVAADTGSAVAVDGGGGVYVAGKTEGAFPGYVNAGRSDAFLRKYDASGSELWTRQFGTYFIDTAYGMAADGAGGVYVAGILEFDGFVRKFDAAGNQAWDRRFRAGQARGVAVDGAGGVYVTGLAFGVFDGQTGAGNVDAFLLKYDAAGSPVWTRQFGTANRDEALGVALDGDGVYVAGKVSISGSSADAILWKYATTGEATWIRQFGTSAVDGAAGVAAGPSGVVVPGDTAGTFSGETSAGSVDAFVRAYDTAGSVAWTRQFGSVSPDAVQDTAFGVATDEAGGTYVAGRTSGSLPGQASAGGEDAFLRKYDAAGGEAWTRQFGGSGFDQAVGVAVDRAGGVYLVGDTRTPLGDFDAFLRKYDAAGNEVWSRPLGTAEWESAYGVSVDGVGGVFVVGTTGGAFPGETNDGGLDIFLAKYDLVGNEVWTRQVGYPEATHPWKVAADGNGGAYVTGLRSEEDPDTGDSIRTALLWKYDADSSVVWERQGLRSSGGGFGKAAVAVDAAGGVYWTEEIDTAHRDREILLHKYSAAGTELWTRQFGTSTFDAVLGLAADAAGGVYVTGYTAGAFGGEVSAGEGDDVFLRKYDTAGEELWNRQFDIAYNDTPYDVGVDRAGHVSVAGGASAQGSSNLDAFVARVDRIQLRYLDTQGTALTLSSTSPDATTASYRDSTALKFSGGNPWRTIGTWTRSADAQNQTISSLGTVRGWIGLKNADDQGSQLDLRAELLKNGVPIGGGETYCIRGLTADPSMPSEVFVRFGAIQDAALGPKDVLAIRISARMGTDGNGAFCGGRLNAAGARLYFDAASRPSRFEIGFG